jgi:hypothetical protein
MTSRHAWWTVSTVGLVLLSLAAPGLAQAAATRHSGTVATRVTVSALDTG